VISLARNTEVFVAAADVAYASIRDGILSGEFPPGHRLGEVELATLLGTSRTPVREALRRLGADGLIETEPNRGARVRTWDDRDLESLFSVRALIEGFAAGLAAQHVGLPQLAELHTLCDQMDAVAAPGPEHDLHLVANLNERFHAAVHLASRNQLVPGLARSLIQIPMVVRTFMTYTPARLAESMRQHRDILSALTMRDSNWAEAAMRNHVLSARPSLMAAVTPAAPLLDSVGD
jgi:DNA-binding GntR family transcriptional regulator